MSRKGEFSRKTRETHIELKLDLDGKGVFDINTGIGFFNHMLETFSKHSLIDLRLDGSGDINVDYHHFIEDAGILVGKSIRDLLGDLKGVRRFGSAVVPLDEALAEVSIDISGRPGCFTDFSQYSGTIGNFNFELVEVFFSGFASAGHTLHILVKRGNNLHHIAEAACKAFARAIREAVEIDPKIQGIIPSTKEYIEV